MDDKNGGKKKEIEKGLLLVADDWNSKWCYVQTDAPTAVGSFLLSFLFAFAPFAVNR